MFDFDVNAVADVIEFADVLAFAAECEASLEQELVRIEKGFYILDDEAEAFEIEDEAEEIDARYKCLLENPDDGSRTLHVMDIYTLKEVLETGGANLIEKVRVENGY